MSEVGGFKVWQAVASEQELAKVKKAAGNAWTRLSAGAVRIKPPELAVAVCIVPDLFGGRPQSIRNEHAHGGHDDE